MEVHAAYSTFLGEYFRKLLEASKYSKRTLGGSFGISRGSTERGQVRALACVRVTRKFCISVSARS